MSQPKQSFSLKALLFGGEASGKTTLAQQLKALGNGCNIGSEFSIMKEGSTLELAPTTGQELHVIQVQMAACQKHQLEMEKGGKSIVAASSTSSFSGVRFHSASSVHNSLNNNQGELFHEGTPQRTTKDEEEKEKGNNNVGKNNGIDPQLHQKVLHIQIKEIGGRMVSIWSRFVKIETDTPQQAMMFVIDVSNPAHLPLAITEFSSLMCLPSRAKDIASWPVLLLFNKITAAPSTIPVGYILEMLSAGWINLRMPPQSIEEAMGGSEVSFHKCQLSERVTCMEIDTWSGEGLMDVMEWLCQHAAGSAL